MLKRKLYSLITEALTDSPVVLLNGARQTGKSTLVKQIAEANPSSYYASLDEVDILAAAKADPKQFIESWQGLLVIDEIQRAPELLLAIKAAIDRQRAPGRFLLTGSADVLLLPKVAESLAGRIEIHTLWPFAQTELVNSSGNFIDTIFNSEISLEHLPLCSNADLINLLLTGGYPEMQIRTQPPRRAAWFRSYVTTVIHREIHDLANIEGLSELPRLLQLLAVRSGSLLNYAELSRSMGLAQTTLKRYMALLEAIFIVKLLPAWSTNLSKRLVKAPKLLLNDSGLSAYLTGMDENRLQQHREKLGQLLEVFVITELFKQSSWSQTQPNFFHYRTHEGVEVDLLLEDTAGRLVGIEVKSAASVTANDFKSLRSLAEVVGSALIKGIVFYQGERVLPFGKNLYAVPLSALWKSAD